MAIAGPSDQSYLNNWIPIEWDSEVIMRVLKSSAVEALGQRHPMNTLTKRILRQAGYNVTAGSTYTVDAGALDYITLTAVRFMGQSVLDEDDLSDASLIVDTIAQRAADWAVSYATSFDNACLGVTAAGDGAGAPFTSVYKSVRTTNAATSYTADANYVNNSGGASAYYDDLSTTLKKVEAGDYWDGNNALIIAHPEFRDVLRRTKDTVGEPIFVQGQGGDSGTPDSLFGVEIFWSRGAKTSPAMSSTPGGNPLVVFVGDRGLLKLGVRSGPESRVDVSRAHDTVDDTAVKFRTRRAFSIGHEKGFAVLEKTGA